MRKIIKNKYSLYKTINVSVQCSLKKREREREKMLSYTKDMEMVRSWHLVLYRYKTKQWGKKRCQKTCKM